MLYFQQLLNWHTFCFIYTIMTHTLKDKVKDMEKVSILKALRECNWVQARAARKLGITERMIGYKIKKYGIVIKEVVGKEELGVSRL